MNQKHKDQIADSTSIVSRKHLGQLMAYLRQRFRYCLRAAYILNKGGVITF